MSLKKEKLKFLDFCAGIGGGRLGLELNNFKCVGFSEIDKKAIDSYKSFFDKEREENLGDLMEIPYESIPDVDLLIAGFPCQTFSIVGKRDGFNDERGKIIFKISEILKAKNIKYFILENVKGLVNLNSGKELKEIIKLLSSSGYDVQYKVLNSYNFGTPQIRERVYFVGFRKDLNINNFVFPDVNDKPSYDLSDFLINRDKTNLLTKEDKRYETLIKYLNNKYNKNKFTIDDILALPDYTVLDTRQSDLRIYHSRVPTLRKGRHGILYVLNKQLRHLSGTEGLLLQGFTKEFYNKGLNISNGALLGQVGNAMTASVISAISKNIKKLI